MGNEASRSLQEAEKLLVHIKDFNGPLPEPLKIRLEDVSRRLLEHFVETADSRYFTAFYHLSKEVIHAYTFRHLMRNRLPSDPEELINRLYILLFEKLLAPGEKVPLDYLFPWCYRVVMNLVKEEARTIKLPGQGIRDSLRDPNTSSQMDHLIALEQESQNRERLERILDVLYSDEAGLSSRDRRIMRMFYLENRPIREIARELDLKKAHVGVILMRARKRIARRLGREC